MSLEFLTPEVFDTLIIVIIIVGLALAAVRFYQDVRRPVTRDRPTPYWSEEDTDQHRPVEGEEKPS